ncbi:hypothetical protein ACP70R_043804 [Stipagrostis hirtigluma subsp. patula]
MDKPPTVGTHGGGARGEGLCSGEAARRGEGRERAGGEEVYIGAMSSFINAHIFEKLEQEAARFAHCNKKPTITSAEIQSSVRLVLPGVLAAVSEDRGYQVPSPSSHPLRVPPLVTVVLVVG